MLGDSLKDEVNTKLKVKLKIVALRKKKNVNFLLLVFNVTQESHFVTNIESPSKNVNLVNIFFCKIQHK